MLTSEGGGGGTIDGSRVGDGAGSRADLRAYVYVGLMVVFGSTTAAAARYIVRELPPAWVPVVRFGVAGLFLLPWWPTVRSWSGSSAATGRCCSSPLRCASRLTRDSSSTPRGWADLARRLVLCDLSAGRPAPRLVDAAGTPRPGPALGRAGERGGRLASSGSAAPGTAGPPHEVRGTMLADLLLIGAVLSWGGISRSASRWSCDTDRCRC